MKRSSLAFGLLASFGLLSALPLSARNVENLTVLSIGGGPNPSLNQVAIESNVRYVDSVLPKTAKVRTLFADGTKDSSIVLYTEPFGEESDAEKAFRFLFERNPSGVSKLRPPNLREVDGASSKEVIRAEVSRIATQGTGPVLMYFTGHGERGRDDEHQNNLFALWQKGGNVPNQDALSVRELAGEIAKLPANRPVMVVMVQCFSGAFANILFEKGDPKGKLLDRPICGFFATTNELVAAGCTPEINEADYHDYTSYFYAALTGKDRLGRTVKATDFNHDGIIGMDEANLYALMNEPSIDVPVCTSDEFLRHFVNVNDNEEIAKMPYSTVRRMASPGQQAALDAISQAVGATGEERLETALADVRARNGNSGGSHSMQTPEMVSAINKASDVGSKLIEEFPPLDRRRNRPSPEAFQAFREARQKAIAALKERPDTVKEVLDIQKLVQQKSNEAMADELRGARWLRLLRLAKTVVLENRLRQSGDKELIARFDQLKALESQNPLR